MYTPETDSSPGHYDLLVTQHDIKTCNSVIDLSFENTGEIFQFWRNFCHCASKEKHSSCDLRRIFNDKEKILVSPQGDSNEDVESFESELKSIGSNKQHRTLAEANQNLDLSGYDYFGSAVPIFSSSNSYQHLNLHDFLFDSADEGCIANLTNLLESHNLQHVLHSKSRKSNEIKFPSFKRALFLSRGNP